MTTADAVHPHVIELRRELEYDGGTWRYLMIIVTDLSLDPGDPAHSRGAISDMVKTVSRHLKETGASGYNSLTIRNP